MLMLLQYGDYLVSFIRSTKHFRIGNWRLFAIITNILSITNNYYCYRLVVCYHSIITVLVDGSTIMLVNDSIKNKNIIK